MKFTTIVQRRWSFCERCARVARFERVRIVRPVDPDWRTRLWIRLYHFANPFRCIECPYRRTPPTHPGPVTSIEQVPLERLFGQF
jgi:hypothetical protein